VVLAVAVDLADRRAVGDHRVVGADDPDLVARRAIAFGDDTSTASGHRSRRPAGIVGPARVVVRRGCRLVGLGARVTAVGA